MRIQGETIFRGLVVACLALLVGSLVALACVGCASTHDHDATTPLGISVDGPGAVESIGRVDGDYVAVSDCWKMAIDPEHIVVVIRPCVAHNAAGTCVIQGMDGSLCYGMTEGYTIWVGGDFAALKHELSHLFRPDLDNGYGRCWL